MVSHPINPEINSDEFPHPINPEINSDEFPHPIFPEIYSIKAFTLLLFPARLGHLYSLPC